MAGRLAFIVTEDGFFASHYLPMARAAGDLGLAVDVITPIGEHRAAIESTGARAVPFGAGRRGLNPITAGYAAGQLASTLNALAPDIVHCIALRSVLIGGTAAAMAGIDRRVYALPGLGQAGARQDRVGRLSRAAIRLLVTGALQSPGTRYLFENEEDPRELGLDPDDRSRVTIVGGCGIDPDLLRPTTAPLPPPLKVAVVSRMLWSQGVDLAVEACRRARQNGAAVELSLFGAPERSGPRRIREETLRGWDAEPGISWHGPVGDVGAIWRAHHVACLPSRGGEGLPRTLLEAAACGRPIVTTDVPGCRRLVRNGIEGFVVPPEDPAALAEAFAKLGADPVLIPRMGAAARARVLHGFTERDVMDDVKRLYSAMLASPPAR